MENTPKILKKISSKEFRESGCCFMSCGGAPGLQQNDPVKIYKKSSIRKKLRKSK